jgi:mannose-6-phosphate isomerase-like protein (cupin superfamily)
VYIPAGAEHQTITDDEELSYLLFNYFLDPRKEGHATFADHIAKVKEIRRRQAETGRVDVEEMPTLQPGIPARAAKWIYGLEDPARPEAETGTALLDRRETAGFDLLLITLAAANERAEADREDREESLFILSGEGSVRVPDESSAVAPGDLVFLPRGEAYVARAGISGLRYLCFRSHWPAQHDGRSVIK